jgi:hypothetical protein
MSESQPSTERRLFQRYSVRCDCWLEQDTLTLYGTTADLGLGGLFLRSAVPMVDGSVVEIVLTVAGAGQPIVAHGLVTRAVRAGRGARHGIGVKFQKIVQGSEALRSFLSATPRLLVP